MPILPKSRKARRRLMVVAVAAPILAAAVGLSLWASQSANLVKRHRVDELLGSLVDGAAEKLNR